MAYTTTAPARLRAAFRYAYLALLAVFIPFAVYCATFGLIGRHAVLNAGLMNEFPAFVAALGLGLIVPLFLGIWLFITATLLGYRPR